MTKPVWTSMRPNDAELLAGFTMIGDEAAATHGYEAWVEDSKKAFDDIEKPQKQPGEKNSELLRRYLRMLHVRRGQIQAERDVIKAQEIKDDQGRNEPSTGSGPN